MPGNARSNRRPRFRPDRRTLRTLEPNGPPAAGLAVHAISAQLIGGVPYEIRVTFSRPVELVPGADLSLLSVNAGSGAAIVFAEDTDGVDGTDVTFMTNEDIPAIEDVGHVIIAAGFAGVRGTDGGALVTPVTVEIG